MLIRIMDGLIIDHTQIRSVKKDTHSGGTKPLLNVFYADPLTGSLLFEKIFDPAEIDRVYGLVAAQAK